MAARPPQAFVQSGWFRGPLALASLALALLLWSVLCTAASAGVPWNPARLAPAYALAAGLPIYALPDSGAQIGWFYGPGFPLWYLPITLVRAPTLALLLAGVWNLLTWLLPVALVLRAAGVAGGRGALAGSAGAGVFLLGGTVTNYGFYFIHVDAPCLAAGIVACLALHRAARPGGRGWIHLAAVGLVAAIWTKQIAVMLAPALILWLWREGRCVLIKPLLFWSLVYGGAVSAAVFQFFGTDAVLFDTWFLQSRNPVRGGALLLFAELGRLIGSMWVWLPLLALAGWLGTRPGPGRRLPPGAASLVRLLAWAALTQLPAGLAALLRAGGGLNSLHSLHYLLLAGLITGWHCLGRAWPGEVPRWTIPGLLWLGALAAPLGNAAWLATGPGSHWTIPADHDRLLALARAQPARYYFPWNPLVTLLADRRVQPLDDALYCLWLCGVEVPAEKVRAAVFRDPIILYEEPAQSRFALRYFPRRPAGGPQ